MLNAKRFLMVRIDRLDELWKKLWLNALHAADNWLFKNRDGVWFCAAGPVAPSIP